MTHPPEDLARVGAFDAAGLNRCQIARATGIPRSTVSRWLNGRVPTRTHSRLTCFRCTAATGPFPWLLEVSYPYLLGLYLGDGCLLRAPRNVLRLNVSLDAAYPGIVLECQAAMTIAMPKNKATIRRHADDNCVEVNCYSRHWPCLFPQHGPGPKHRRKIELEPWQREFCNRYPWRFLRGLIHSDGCRSINTVRHPRKTYAYPRYQFSNRSDDIRWLFCEYCDKVGVDWRRMNRWAISVARRQSVELMDRHIGPKR